MIHVANPIERGGGPASQSVYRRIVYADVGALLRIVTDGACAGREIKKLGPVSTVECELRHLRTRNQRFDICGLFVDGLVNGLCNVNLLGDLVYVHGDCQRQRVPNINLDILLYEVAKAWDLDRDAVKANRQVGYTEITISICGCCTPHCELRALNYH